MRLLNYLRFLQEISRSQDIVRRYFVVNGFDGALTMLGLVIGFEVSGSGDLQVIINACLGAAIARGMSGVSSAYVSEVAERKRVLGKLEQAMIERCLQRFAGNISRTARALGLSRAALYRRFNRYGIEPEHFLAAHPSSPETPGS